MTTERPPEPDQVDDADLVEMQDLTIEATRDAAGLQPMERRFADHALALIAKGEKFWRQEAARRAGYREPRGSASVLIRRPRVVEYMSRRMTEAAEEVNVDRKFILFRALANMLACEALGDYRTAHRYLDTIGKHVDVAAFNRPGSSGVPGQGANLANLDLASLSEDEMVTMVTLLRKAAGGKPTE